MATMMSSNGDSSLAAIASKASAFPSGSCFNRWQSLIYSCVPVMLDNYADPPNTNNPPNASNIEDPGSNCQGFLQMQMSMVRKKLHFVFWQVAELVPHIKHIREKKLIHHQALQLVKCLCEEILSLNDSSAYDSHFKGALFEAARQGIHEVVEEILDTFPAAKLFTDEESHVIFQVAVIERWENVFKLLYHMNAEDKQFYRLCRLIWQQHLAFSWKIGTFK
ncbi:uncharacterized protein LOC132308749 [Cornus florida]|uniref:uncharacterized protein LOC132308749 n=1 Tax=Cornus florida TaxID=4283 RepID=UPI002899C84A|nr:uncharacterized protein LOC132308749 [Cornus florida]